MYIHIFVNHLVTLLKSLSRKMKPFIVSPNFSTFLSQQNEWYLTVQLYLLNSFCSSFHLTRLKLKCSGGLRSGSRRAGEAGGGSPGDNSRICNRTEEIVVRIYSCARNVHTRCGLDCACFEQSYIKLLFVF